MKRYWDLVEIGDSLPQAVKTPISRLQIAQFAAASDDFSPLNLDDEFAKNAGFRSVYAPGLMSLGFIEDAIRAFGTNIRILSLSGTFQRLIWPGDVLTTNGLVLRRHKKNEEYRILVSFWCENQNQEVVMKGNTTCLLFKNADHENRSKSQYPKISDATHENMLKKYAHLVADVKVSEKSSARKELV